VLVYYADETSQSISGNLQQMQLFVNGNLTHYDHLSKA